MGYPFILTPRIKWNKAKALDKAFVSMVEIISTLKVRVLIIGAGGLEWR
jgi:hypothetical protein